MEKIVITNNIISITTKPNYDPVKGESLAKLLLELANIFDKTGKKND